MSQASRLTLSYRKERTIGPLHTGGPIVVTADAKRIVTCLVDQAVLTNVETGEQICRFSTDTSDITAMALAPSETELVIVSASLSLRIYNMPSLYSQPLSKPLHPARVIPKAHEAPVHVAVIDPTSSYVATGSADGIVKIWDLKRGYATHIYKGHGGVISCLTFHVLNDRTNEHLPPKIWLGTGCVDTRVRIFDLSHPTSNAKPVAVLDGHVSVPRGIAFSEDGDWILTSGRDSVVLVWKVKTETPKPKQKTSTSYQAVTVTLTKTIPVSEAVEAIGIIDRLHNISSISTGGSFYFFVAGEKGAINIWDAREGKRLYSLKEQLEYQSPDSNELQVIQDAIYCPSAATIVALHADHSIIFHSLKDLTVIRQLVGFNDEIVDALYLSHPSASQDSYLALATNSSMIRTYATEGDKGLGAHLLSGHADIVLALDCSADGRILVSGGKDNTVRVWSPIEEAPGQWGCVAIGEGHAESVGALAISRKTGVEMPSFTVTGSQDRTIKLWDLKGIPGTWGKAHAKPHKVTSLITQKTHEKDVNSLDISPNDHLLATGSQDKTAKIFEIKQQHGGRVALAHLGTLKGHKRGIWCVKFSKTEKLVATASGDKTVKLWTLDDYACIKTFEGHTNSVLRVAFISGGHQVLTTASDGLLKLWNVENEECMATMDNHEDKVWALAISRDERTVVTAAADSVITFWGDSTEIEQQKKEEQKERHVAKEQDLANYVALQDYRSAIFLALSMEHPRRLYTLFNAVAASRRASDTDVDEMDQYLSQASNITGSLVVDELIASLPALELGKLIRCIRDWNATGRTSSIAQLILHAVIKLRPTSDIRSAFVTLPPMDAISGLPEDGSTLAYKQGDSLNDVLDALIPYTERHLSRVDRHIQDSYILDFLLSEMGTGDLEGEEA